MSVQQSFDRLATLKVFNRQVSPGGAGGSILDNVDKTGTAFASRLGDGSAGFRITFNVVKMSGPVPVPNPVTINIYNLGPQSRALVSKTNNLVVLEAGYGTQSDVVFTGNVLRAITAKQGADYVTTIQAADGMFAFQNSLINQSFGKGVSVQSVVDTVIGSMKGAGVDRGLVQGVPSATYNQGIVLSGKSIEQLRQVCDRHDLNFSIQDGKVTITPYGQGKGTAAVVLSSDTGLIGIPQIREVDVNGNNLISFRCLMNPKLGPFQDVVISSKFVNGIYTCAKVTHTGDTFGGSWYSEGEASNQRAST